MRVPALKRNDAGKTALLPTSGKQWPSRDQWLRDAKEFSQRIKAKPPGSGHFGVASFILIVLLPTIAAIVYFGLLASGQYYAEARFVMRSLRDRSLATDIGASKTVRNATNPFVGSEKPDSSGGSSSQNASADPTSKTPGGLTSTLSSLIGAADDRQISIDAFVLSSFIASRNMVAELNKDDALRKAYSRREADWLARLDPSASMEEIWRYWRGKVTPSVDAITGIVTLRVLAFRPEDALAIADDVLRICRKVVNDYSQRIREDTVKSARATLAVAAKSYEETLVALRDFRDVDRSVNPVSATVEKLKALAALETERARAERDQWVSARVTSAESIPTRSLGERVASLTQQIDKLQGELTEQQEHAKAESAAIGQYRDLELTRIFAERSYASAEAAFERARFEAEYTGIALAVFLPPRKPEMALFPRRMTNILLTFAIAGVVWALLRVIAAGIAEFRVLRH
jgi:capsular polysaccharide transport system permease protein